MYIGFKRRRGAGRCKKAKKKWLKMYQNRQIIETIMQMDVESLRSGLKPSDFACVEKPTTWGKKRERLLFTKEILKRQKLFLKSVTKTLTKQGK